MFYTHCGIIRDLIPVKGISVYDLRCKKAVGKNLQTFVAHIWGFKIQFELFSNFNGFRTFKFVSKNFLKSSKVLKIKNLC